jgi:hypothetical protein
MVLRRLMVAARAGLTLAMIALATPTLVLAQSERGGITGIVEDSSKAPVPGVSVKVVNTATNATTTVVSSDGGSYSATNLSPGTYRIEASIEGFQSATVDGIPVTAGATTRIDVSLSPGAVTETVKVEARCRKRSPAALPTSSSAAARAGRSGRRSMACRSIPTATRT